LREGRITGNHGAGHPRPDAGPTASITAFLAERARLLPAFLSLWLAWAPRLAVDDLARAPEAPDGGARVHGAVVLLVLADCLAILHFALLAAPAVITITRGFWADGLTVLDPAGAERALGEHARVGVGAAAVVAVIAVAVVTSVAVVAVVTVIAVAVVISVVIVAVFLDTNTLAVVDLANLVVLAIHFLARVLGWAAPRGLGRRDGDEEGEEGVGKAHFVDFFLDEI